MCPPHPLETAEGATLDRVNTFVMPYIHDIVKGQGLRQKTLVKLWMIFRCDSISEHLPLSVSG